LHVTDHLAHFQDTKRVDEHVFEATKNVIDSRFVSTSALVVIGLL
jgi:hypothetical protein